METATKTATSLRLKKRNPLTERVSLYWWWEHTGSNRGPSACKADLKTSETLYWQYFHDLLSSLYKLYPSNLTG